MTPDRLLDEASRSETAAAPRPARPQGHLRARRASWPARSTTRARPSWPEPPRCAPGAALSRSGCRRRCSRSWPAASRSSSRAVCRRRRRARSTLPRPRPRSLATALRRAALGPGLAPGRARSRLVQRLLAAAGPPVVVDAGALDALAGSPGWAGRVRRPCVLTPHPGRAAAPRPHARQHRRGAPAAARAAAAAWRPGRRCSRAPTPSSPSPAGGVLLAPFSLPLAGHRRQWRRPGRRHRLAPGAGPGALRGCGAGRLPACPRRRASSARSSATPASGHGPAAQIPRARRALRDRGTGDGLARPGSGWRAVGDLAAAPRAPGWRSTWRPCATTSACSARWCGPAALAPVVKADAYGHGLVPVGRALRDARRCPLRGHARRGHRAARGVGGPGHCCSTRSPQAAPPTPSPAAPS